MKTTALRAIYRHNNLAIEGHSLGFDHIGMTISDTRVQTTIYTHSQDERDRAYNLIESYSKPSDNIRSANLSDNERTLYIDELTTYYDK